MTDTELQYLLQDNIPLSAIDFETTGTARGFPNEPWQVGICTFTLPFKIITTTSHYLHISENRPISAPGRHGQLRHILATSPTLSSLPIPLLCPIIAHNSSTEKSILQHAFPLTPLPPILDTLRLSRTLITSPSYDLPTLLAHENLLPSLTTICPTLSPHDALFDAIACALLFSHLSHLAHQKF